MMKKEQNQQSDNDYLDRVRKPAVRSVVKNNIDDEKESNIHQNMIGNV